MFLAPKDYINYLVFQSFDNERTWWRLFWAYLMKVILSVPDEDYYVPDEGYFEHTWWRLFWAYLMKVILSVPDEGYSQTCIVHTKLIIYIFIIFSVVLSLIQTIHGLSTSSLKPLILKTTWPKIKICFDKTSPNCSKIWTRKTS